jgi:hypothetical protein
MAMPAIIEYLVSRPQADGQLVTLTTSQIGIPALPGNMSITLTETPESNYAIVIFDIRLEPDIVPNVFWHDIQYSSVSYAAGIITAAWTGSPFYSYMTLTQQQPVTITVRNRTNVAHHYGLLMFGMSIPTEYDYENVSCELENIGTSKLEPLASEANVLLRSLNRALGMYTVPRPHAGGNS